MTITFFLKTQTNKAKSVSLEGTLTIGSAGSSDIDNDLSRDLQEPGHPPKLQPQIACQELHLDSVAVDLFLSMLQPSVIFRLKELFKTPFINPNKNLSEKINDRLELRE